MKTILSSPGKFLFLLVALIFFLPGSFVPPISAGEKIAVKPIRLLIAYGPGKNQYRDYKKYLESNFYVNCLLMESEKSRNEKETNFTGIEYLDDCDVILSNLYRTWAPPAQLAKLKKAFLSKPVIGMRKAHHGFQNWLEADKVVFGVDYRGHYGNSKNGFIRLVKGKENHPFFKGMKVTIPGGGCYSHRDPAEDLEVYMVGGKKSQEPHPQTWSRIVKERGKQRVFYTRYDHHDLADHVGVRDMITRVLFWSVQKDINKYKK